MKTKANTEEKILVAEVYWQVDQKYKQAEIKRGNVRDLALVAIPKGETVGPVEDDLGTGHWLTHGEKERVEMSPITLWHSVADSTDMTFEDVISLCDVNVARLKAEMPGTYNLMLKHKSTRRTRHSCLTWGSKAPVTKPKAKRI